MTWAVIECRIRPYITPDWVEVHRVQKVRDSPMVNGKGF